MDEEVERKWRAVSEGILTDIKAWRQAHPKATFREIEQAVHEGTTRLEAQVLQDTAQASASGEWSGKAQEERPHCPVCGTALQALGNSRGNCKGQEGKQWYSREAMEPARPVGSGFFPLDEELGFLPGSLTPTQHEHLVHLATVMPFGQAGKMLESLLGVQISEATVRRLTERAGAAYEQVQTTESQEPEPETPTAPPLEPAEKPLPLPLKQAISSDGASVPLISGEWAARAHPGYWRC